MEINGKVIKEINLNKMRCALKSEGSATKPRLAQLTGLSVVTAGTLIKVLVGNGEAIEDNIQPSNGGRPAVSFRFNSQFSLTLIIYMHEKNKADTAFVCVTDLYGEILEKSEIILNSVNKTSFDGIIGKMLLKYPNIKVIGFGMPGEEVNGKLAISDYSELRDEIFIDYIQEKFKVNTFFENDINAAIEGYCYDNGIAEEQCAVGIYFPSKYPPGAGIFIDGKIHKGRNGLAGEISYLPLGIDWSRFDYKKENIEDAVIKIVRSFNCMYNPDIIVLYCEDIDESIVEKIKEKCNSKVEALMMPEIVVSSKFNDNFEVGIKQIALGKLKTID